MKWSQILGLTKECMHDKVPLDCDYSYCPDCGELIENRWYLVRCKSCGLKEAATVKNGEILPVDNFCHNCGGKEFYVERLDKIDCININYAVLVKTIVKNEINEYSQCWTDTIQTSYDTQKLLQ